MAVDMFLVIPDVKGETEDAVYSRKTKASTSSPGAGVCPSPALSTHGSGGGAGKANFQDISITKFVDSSSANLMLYCSQGEHYKEAKLDRT